MNEGFSKLEARSAVGTEVEALLSRPEVPAGTRGRIVGARKRFCGEWQLRVKWDLPAKRSEIWAQLFDFSINVPWTTASPISEFTKRDLGHAFRRLIQDRGT